ncbi:unnamed protein product [Chrysoparadoxa australica]
MSATTPTPVSSLPPADWQLADRGYEADWFRETLIERKNCPPHPAQ